MGARKRKRALLLAAAALCGALLAAIAIISRGFGLIDSGSVDPRGRAAQQRCERDVVARLVAPSTAKLTDVTVTSAQLDPEVMDLFSLLSGGRLNGVDHSRISVQSVEGVVVAPNEMGGTLHDPFTCRAYFVDGDLVDTLVVFDHDH
ncbi:hypothetical protein [Mycolicibacterium austroafricanum]|uniref:hypothetical protein n=1 Tax=Mycolicibacterium austroafricanum TaxID=39687 RepID=UPI001CA345F2|nr:hypothetical protein [Mycolicibacterium austroafricanum]QZT54992.1 hypothetical protein JN084_18430 [Mycolicibacterium austroafricanum]